MRTDSLMIGGLKVSQVVAAICFFLALAVIVKNRIDIKNGKTPKVNYVPNKKTESDDEEAEDKDSETEDTKSESEDKSDKKDTKAKKEKKGLPLLWWLFHKEPFGGVIGNKYQVKLFGIIPISDTAADVACVLGVMIAALAAMLYILKKAEKLRAEMTVELEDGGKIPAADSQVLRW